MIGSVCLIAKETADYLLIGELTLRN
jgi:hypothetical protein